MQTNHGVIPSSSTTKQYLSLLGLAAGLVLTDSGASASILTIDLTTEFSGATQPNGTYSVTLDDTACGTDCVEATFSASSGSGENVDEWYLNFDDSKDVTSLTFTPVSGYTATVTGSSNAYKADGDGLYDILFAFGPGGFVNPGTSVYDITGISGLTVNDFAFLSCSTCPTSGGNTSYESAAHVQNIGTSGASGWIGGNGDITVSGQEIPEPGILSLLGLGLVGLGFSTLRRRCR